MKDYICVNGRILERSQGVIPALDRGFLYGYGLFETIRILPKGPVFLEDHLNRLEDSAAKIGLKFPNRGVIKRMIFDTIEASKLYDGSLRVTVSAGAQREYEHEEGAGPNVVVTVKHGVPYSNKYYRDGFRAGFLKSRRNSLSPLVKLKTLNFLENILGRQEALQLDWDEGIFLNNEGYLCEGTVSNLFLVQNEVLFTPDIECGLLPGITRKKVMDLASENYMRVEECQLKPRELLKADEAFLTNSLMGVMPLVRVDGREIGSTRPGPLTMNLIKAYNELAGISK